MSIQVLSYNEAIESYEEMLNECHPEVTIGYSTFSPADIMRELDPPCYRIGFTEYCDNMADDEVFLVEGYTDDRLQDMEEEE